METTAAHTTIRPKTDIIKAAARDVSRYEIGDIQYDNGRLIATDGRMLAVASADVIKTDATPATMMIPRECFASNVREISCNGQFTAKIGKREVVAPAPESSHFPQWKDVLPKDAPSVRWISLDAGLLARLAQALGASDGRVMIGIPERSVNKSGQHRAECFRVLAGDGRDETAFGVLMGCALERDPEPTWNHRAAAV